MANDSMEKDGRTHQGRLALAIVLCLLVIDQVIKIRIKTHMAIGDCMEITPWFKILFVENIGMAFGWQFIGKLFLSLFRIVAIGAFVWYLVKIINRGFPTGYIITVAVIVAGAVGNLLDCMFYGLIFSESTVGPGGTASLVPFGEGYAPFLYGKVVDMFYFPLWTWPDWLPLLGGKIFFSPIFNFADSCITCGVIVLLLFYTKVVNMGLVYKEKSDESDEKGTADGKDM